MTVTAGVAAIKGTYAGTCVLSDLHEPASLVMKLDGAGAPGTIGATVNVGFADGGDGTTRVTWDADAVVGGMIGGVGQRMLTSVSKRMAGEFFGNVDKALSGGLPAARAAGAASEAAVPAAGQVFTAPATTSRHLQPVRLRQGHRRRRRPGPPRRRRRLPVRAAAVSWRSGYPVDRVSRDVRRRCNPDKRAGTTPKFGPDARPDRRLDRPGDGGGHREPRDLVRRADGPPPGPDRREEPPAQRRSSASTRTGPGTAPARPTGRRTTSAGRCTGCRGRSRTPTRWRGGGRPTARPCTPTTCRSATS